VTNVPLSRGINHRRLPARLKKWLKDRRERALSMEEISALPAETSGDQKSTLP